MEIRIRTARPTDARALYDISCRTHQSAIYRTLIPPGDYERFRNVYEPNKERCAVFVQNIQRQLADPSYMIWVALVGDVVAGYTIAQETARFWVLKSLFVLPDYQGRGLGRRLFRASCEAAPAGMPIELTVIQANGRAVKLYEQEGFRYCKPADKAFYGTPQMVMCRH